MIDQPYRAYIGNLEQIFSVRKSRIDGGRGDGVRVIDIQNGGNLAITVLPDRGMDIYTVRYKGKNMSYLTPNGISHPAYYNPFGEGWSESFNGGFLYTCGLSHAGIKEEGWTGQKEHGCLANIPAENYSISVSEDEQGPYVVLKSRTREAMLCGPNLVLDRTIRVFYQKDLIEFEDTVTNESFQEQEFFLLYHCNTGYPLLSEKAKLTIPYRSVRGRTPYAESNIERAGEIWAPTSREEEMCFYYEIIPDSTGWATVSLENPDSGIGMLIDFDTTTLDQFLQWKNYVKGEYVCGLEPCNATLDGVEDARKRKSIHTLKPGESRTHRMRFRFKDVH